MFTLKHFSLSDKSTDVHQQEIITREKFIEKSSYLFITVSCSSHPLVNMSRMITWYATKKDIMHFSATERACCYLLKKSNKSLIGNMCHDVI